jgi:hypothetical protein
MENIKEEKTKIEVVPKPIWKIILIWIVYVWAILTLGGVIIALFAFFINGVTMNIGEMGAGLLALVIVIKFRKYIINKK